MNHIYLGLSLSLICLFLAYLILSKLLLVTVLCVILAGWYFKDDFILFRYVAAHVASFYLWICELFSGIQNMYHQSNNTNFPARKFVENNGTVSRKYERLHHGSSYNLSTSYVIDNQPLNSGIWDSGSKFSPQSNSIASRAHSTLQEMSKLNINHRVRGESSTKDAYSKSYISCASPLKITYSGHSKSTDPSRNRSSTFSTSLNQSSNIENNPPLNAKLYADVTSPGFCGRVADRLPEIMTHQPKYDTVGAFPVVNLKCQSPKIKIKTPVRVRLAPPSNEIMHYNYGTNTVPRSPVLGPDDSMKSVLQVLKEISRKRIHSHIDEESDEGSKRLRVTDTQFDNDGLLQTSLLQQTIQGKRAREETSPNEDDKKRRKASLKNNEILSSLSSSVSIRPPHLQTAKRKAHSIDDSISTTPVLGKLLKVQTEVTPPAPTNQIVAPDTTVSAEKLNSKTSTSPAVPSPIPPPAIVEPVLTRESSVEKEPEQEDVGAVSRLLGRMSDKSSCSQPVHIPVKKNVFMSTNDLSLSPPKENRLAAMIAVLGGPSEQSELENSQPEAPKQPERIVRGKALFTTPETPATPETPKQNKKVTFSDSLTTTKIFEREETTNGNSSAASNNSLGPPSTPLSVTFSPTVNTTLTGPKLDFGSENASTPKPFTLRFDSSPSSGNEAVKPIESGNFTTTNTSSASCGGSPFGNQTQTQSQPQPISSNLTSASVSGATFAAPAMVSNNSAPSPGGFSFGTNSSNKESLPAVKSISFGKESKTPPPVSSVSGFPSLFSPASPKNEAVKAAQAMNPTGENKTVFNIFGNKDTSSPTVNNEGETKPMVNGFTSSTSVSSPFLTSQPVSQGNTVKPLLPGFAANVNTTTTSQSAATFNFGSTTAFSTSSVTSSATQQLSFTTATQQNNSTNATPFQSNSIISASASPSLNIFNSSTSSPAQAKQSQFGNSIQSSSPFKNNVFNSVTSNNQSPQTNTVFGSTSSQSSGFGNTPALKNGAVSFTSGASQTNNMFSSMTNTSSKPIAFGSEANATTQSSTVFGFSGTPASTQASNIFGISLSNSTSNAPVIFGNTTTAQTTSVFGTPSTGSQSNTFSTTSTTAGQPSLFGNSVNNDTSKNIFAGASASNPAFGNHSNSTPTFGGQNTTTVSTFGNQITPAFTFGTQNTGSTPSQGGFGSTGTFGGSSSSSSTNEVKPSAFGSANPFMFGASSGSKPTEAVKPLGSATPFAFGSSAPQSSSAQPSAPSFGASTTTFGAGHPTPPFGGATQSAAPSFGGATQSTAPSFGGATQSAVPSFGGGASQSVVPSFGGGPTQSAPPTFGGAATQSTAPTFGGAATQSAAPTFQFGQTSSSPATAFQFNAAPPTVGAGMFSIGSGGSSTSRTKTTALRRGYKRT